MDLNTPATYETPQRFVQAMFDATEGYDGDPKLLKVFETECRGGSDCSLSQVIEGPIPFFALCDVNITRCLFTGTRILAMSPTNISSGFPSSPDLSDCSQNALRCRNGWDSRLQIPSIQCLNHTG